MRDPVTARLVRALEIAPPIPFNSIERTTGRQRVQTPRTGKNALVSKGLR
jgi:hypothetical protein